MPSRSESVSLDHGIERRDFAPKSSFQHDADLALLQAQLRLAKSSRGVGHGLGEQKSASLASESASSTPSLVFDARTPRDSYSGAPTPAAVDSTPFNLKEGFFDLRVTDRSSRGSSSRGHRDFHHGRSVESPELPQLHQDAVSRSSRSSVLVDEPLQPLKRPFLTAPSASIPQVPQAAHTPERRCNSLPGLTRTIDGSYMFGEKAPTRALVDPYARPATSAGPGMKPDEEFLESLASSSTQNAVKREDGQDTKQDGDEHAKRSLYVRAREQLIATYAPRVPPPLIMPSGPTDAEKLSYLKTNRLGLYSFGVLSFLSLSAGMWLFVVSAVPFYWFGAMVVLLQAYLFVSYGVSLVGKDFDYDAHLKILEEHPLNEVTAPTVDIYLPCCKEPIEVLANTYKYVKALKYPAGKLKVYVLDDGASPEVEALAKSYDYEYICREDRPRLKKAGNLRWAFARTTGDFFAIYDADFCPREDFLLELVPQHLAHPKTAIVQTPQFFRVLDEQTWVEQGAGGVQELFYRVIQVNRNRWGASICVGSNALYRREALVEVGGTAEIGFSEDVHTGFDALTRGWQVRYVPLCLACGICPDTPRAFFSQQMRWCMGSTTLLTNPAFWKSKLSFMQKLCYLSGMMYYSAISLSIFLNPLPGLLMIWVRPDYVRYYNLAFAVPSLIYSVIAIRCWAKAKYGFNVQFIMAIQSYAYMTAIKDRLFGRALAWVPSGDTKAHKNNKYRNMRILCWVWMLSSAGGLIAGVTYQCLKGFHWYDAFPTMLLMAFNVFLAHRFLFCHGKL